MNTDPKTTADAVVRLGRLALDFGRVERITYHPPVPGQKLLPETDTDHTVMLGLIACAFAARHLPDLNVGLIAQMALVHDLVEVYAGDTPTLVQLNATAAADKQARERAAYERIYTEFAATLPWLPYLLGQYEERQLPEARYVKAMDKLLPKITHLLNGCATIRQQGMTYQQLADRYATQLDELMAYAADFPPLFDLRHELVTSVLGMYANTSEAAA
jgi:5'-deoxynucleotidase YfbR-like HD superfamily hydrolase